jgi:hypothetical protein
MREVFRKAQLNVSLEPDPQTYFPPSLKNTK